MECLAVDEKKRGGRVNERNLFLYPHKCHVCGKRFEARPEYVFKIGQYKKKTMWFCSWKCLQKHRKKGVA